MPTIRFKTSRKKRTFCYVGSLLIGQCYPTPNADTWTVYFTPAAFTMRWHLGVVPSEEAAKAALKRAAEAYL